MDALIKKFYKNYGEYINQYRSFPLFIDGLKPVERRVLLSAYEIARNKFVKSARIDGHTIAHYHAHGTAYGSLVNLVNNKILEGQGNFGSKIGVEPTSAAAMRYTECKMPESTVNLAFKYIKHVPWIESELDNEPEFLPVMFPLCLLGTESTQGIGFGYKTYIPCYKITDLYDRLMYLLGIRKTKPIIKPIIDCEILDSDKSLDHLLTTGKHKLSIQGVVEVQASSCKAILKSWPPNKKFESLLNKFSSELDSADVGFTDLSRKGQTLIVFEVLKQRNKQTIFNNFVAKLKDAVQGNISYECTLSDTNGKTKIVSIDEMLLTTYKMYSDINKVYLDDKKIKIQSLIDEHKLIELLKPYVSKYLKETNDVDYIIKRISEESKIQIERIKEIFQKYNIRKLFSVKYDESELLNQLAEVENNINNIDNFVHLQYQDIIKK